MRGGQGTQLLTVPASHRIGSPKNCLATTMMEPKTSREEVTLLKIWKVQESMQGAFLWVNHSAFLMPPRISAMISLFYLVHLILRLGADLVLLL